jgi:hypothetical protein
MASNRWLYGAFTVYLCTAFVPVVWVKVALIVGVAAVVAANLTARKDWGRGA